MKSSCFIPGKVTLYLDFGMRLSNDTEERDSTQLVPRGETTSDLLIEGAGRAPDHAQDGKADL